MKKISSRMILFSIAATVTLFLISCAKKVILTPMESTTSTITAEKASSAAADPAIAYVSNNNLMVMNADGSNQTVISSGGASTPSWSPDAHSLVFARSGGLWIIDVAVVNGVPTGSNLHQIPFTLAGTQGNPSWSPLGDRIAFTNTTSPAYDRNIYTVSPSGGDLVIVYTSASGLTPRQPDWSPDE